MLLVPAFYMCTEDPACIGTKVITDSLVPGTGANGDVSRDYVCTKNDIECTCVPVCISFHIVSACHSGIVYVSVSMLVWVFCV